MTTSTTTALQFSNVEPLLASTTISRNIMHCRFACPISGHEIEAQVNVDHANRAATLSRMKAKAQSGFMRSLRRSILRLVGSAAGHGEIGRIAREVTSEAVSDVSKKRVYSASEKQNAILAAFRMVASKFTWDVEREAWVLAGAHRIAKTCPSA